MYLKKIYINGFKSFAEKTEIMVEKGITAIVGPNGSGKSNISDAIKWVLGEQSAKSLRGGKMDDVIFAGTQKRMPLGYAEVNLIFDNSSGIIPLEYMEVSIKRKLYKTGESEYYINKQQCRLKDVKELFMDTGIGREGYSFIGQGRVEDILSPNSEVRREVFEEAAGIVKYKTRKEEAQRKLEKTEDNLDRIEDIIHELDERIEPLREQSEKAKKYIDLKNNLKKHELNYFVHEYEKHNDILKILSVQKDSSVEEKERLQKKRDSISETIIKEKEKINDIQIKIKETETLYAEKNKEYESFQGLYNVHSEKRNLYKNNIQHIEEELNVLDERNKELQVNLEKLNEEKLNLTETLNSHIGRFNDLNSEVEDYQILIDKIVKSIEQEKNELFELHKEINKLISSGSTLESFIKNDQDRLNHLTGEIMSEENENSNKNEIIKILKKELEDYKAELTFKNQELTNIINATGDAENEKFKLESEIKNINEKSSNIKSKLNILSNMEAYYDGYYKSIKTLMNDKDKNEMLNKSIMGTVADIIKTKKEYETAVEVALGSAIQNIIVNTEAETENIINYLKNNKIGRVTFLPIETIQERSLNSNEKSILSDSSVINTGDMLVETDPKFNKVIKHLLGRIVVVDNLNNGFRISKSLGTSLRIVTLQGEIINSGGSVTGGHISNNQNLLGRKREIEECKHKFKEYTRIIERKTGELILINDNIKKYKERTESIKNIINEKNNLYAMAESKINILSEQIDKTASVIVKYINEKQYFEEEKLKHENEFFKMQKDIEAYKEKIKEKEKHIEETVLQNESNKIKFQEYNSVILKQRDLVSQIKQDIKVNEEKINNIISETARNSESKKIKEENLINTDYEIQKSTDLMSEYTTRLEILKEEINNITTFVSQDKDILTQLQNNIYEYQNKVNDTNKAITEILDDENSMNVKIEREKSRLEEISAKLWEEYEMNYAMALSYKDDNISQSKIYSDVNSYKKSIKELGNVNLDSINEYKEVKERYDFLTKQKKDLNDAKNQLDHVISELESKMNDKFLDEFSNIRIKFNEVFKKLFNGGSGDVYLEDEADALNSNIEIAVQPPGKKLSKISLLSGGEKSLTAIALLFAILKTKPTPFCILDEIEAALDDINIFRFSQYLKEFSQETQFIVITHRKGTMECADTLYGATMEEKGVTKLVSMKLSDIDV